MHTKKVACRRIWNEQGGLLKEIGGFAEDMGYSSAWWMSLPQIFV